MGLDWRWERLNVIQPPSPTGRSRSTPSAATCPASPTPARRWRASCSARSSSSRSICSRRRSRSGRASRSTSSRTTGRCPTALTINPGPALHAELPVDGDQRPDGRLQPGDPAARLPGRPIPVRPLKKNNFGPRLGAVYRVTDKTIVSAGYGLVWIEMAGITTPFTTPTFPFLQTVSQRALDTISPGVRAAERSERRADCADADGRARPGRVRRRRHARLGLRAAVERRRSSAS